MKMIFTHRPALLMGLLFLCAFLTACSSNTASVLASNSGNKTGAASNPGTIAGTDSDSTGIAGSALKETDIGKENTEYTDNRTLSVRGTYISLGDSKDILVKRLGAPGKIAETEYDFDYYIYNNNYKKLVYIAVKDGLVTGFYTDSMDFVFRGITYGSDLDSVNAALGKAYSMSEVLTFCEDGYVLWILIDKAGTGKVTGVHLLPEDLKDEEYSESVMKNIGLMVYDLTNSIRARNGIPILIWSSSAASASGKHSRDMAEKNYFGHIDPEGKKPGDRLMEEGILHNSVGENIIAGYKTAVLSSHAWFNSAEHRKNILDKRYTCMGAGFFYMADSTYKTYITQDFCR